MNLEEKLQLADREIKVVIKAIKRLDTSKRIFQAFDDASIQYCYNCDKPMCYAECEGNAYYLCLICLHKELKL